MRLTIAVFGVLSVGESNLEALVGTELGRSILSSGFAIALE
jgi:hypothetical protein